jgi:hypothetical protein
MQATPSAAALKIARLRQSAAELRGLAKRRAAAEDFVITTKLEQVAEEMEVKADALEAGATPSPPA